MVVAPGHDNLNLSRLARLEFLSVRVMSPHPNLVIPSLVRLTRRRAFRRWLGIGVLLVGWAAHAQPTPNYLGLWWAAPTGSESGWGINLTHHGDDIFATWFTYDTSGRAWWLSMSAVRTGERTYAGDLIQTSGPAFSAQPFDPAKVTRTPVGTGTLVFADAGSGTFTYRVNGLPQVKSLVRQSFGPAPACVQMATPDYAAAANFQDLWWVADGGESGWGINFAHQGDVIFATWFTYDIDGAPLWLSTSALREGASHVYRGDILRTSGARFDHFDPASVQRRTVGAATITIIDGSHATFAYSIADPALGGPVAQVKAVTRQLFGTGNPTVCYAIPDPSYRASRASPFAAGCEGTADPGTLYPNSEVEPHVAVNPGNPSHLIGVWQQDRWSNGGAKGLLSAASFDGGRTWTPSAAPFSRCTGGTIENGGNYERATDPWVSIGPDGTAYQIAVAFDNGGGNAILASRSGDGGLTWSAPATLIRDGSDPFNDKESIFADPLLSGFAYAVWDRVSNTGHGPTYFSRTTDGGRSWETARPIYDPGGNSQTINNQVVALSDGTLVTFFTRFETAPNGMATATLATIRSTDRGVAWSAPTTIAVMQSIGATDPENGTPVRDGSTLGSIAAGPGNTLVVAWQDARFSRGARDGIAFARSADGGLTWSAPVRISRDPGEQAFLPTIAVQGDGTIGITYFDFRSNTTDPSTLFTDYWLARSSDGGTTWRESRVAGPFDLAIAPNARGLFLGDYQGLVAIGKEFVPFYATVNTGDLADRTSVFASLVTSTGTAVTAAVRTEGVAPGSYRAVSASAARATPDLDRQLTASIVRTMSRRIPGWIPAALRSTQNGLAP